MKITEKRFPDLSADYVDDGEWYTRKYYDMKPTIIVAHEHLSTVLPDVESGDGR